MYIKQELEYFQNHHIRIVILDHSTALHDFPGPRVIMEMINSILIEVLSSIAEQEWLTTNQLQEEGIGLAESAEVISFRQKKNTIPVFLNETVR